MNRKLLFALGIILIVGIISFQPTETLHADEPGWVDVSDGLYGGTFSQIEFSPGYAGDNTFFVRSSPFSLLRIKDGGNSWSMIYTSTDFCSEFIVSPNYSSDQTLYLRTYFFIGNGYIKRSEDGGISWTTQLTVPTSRLTHNGLSGIGISPEYAVDRTLYAVKYTSSGNYILRSIDAGLSWATIYTVETATAGYGPVVFGQGGTFDILVGTGDGIYGSSSNGDPTSWRRLNELIARDLEFSPNYANDLMIFAVGETGIYRCINLGRFPFITLSCTRVGLDDSAVSIIYSLDISPNYENDATIFLSTDAGIYKSGNGGTTWVPMGLSEKTVRDIGISPDYANDTYLLAATDLGLHQSFNGGASWPEMPLAHRVFPKLAASPGYNGNHTVFAALEHSGVFMSINGGQSWSQIRSGDARSIAIPPNYPSGGVVFANIGGILYKRILLRRLPPFSSDWIWLKILEVDVSVISPSPFYTTDSGVFAIADNKVHRSLDGGANWTNSVPGNGSLLHTIAFSPVYQQRIFVGGSGGVAFSDDWGETWVVAGGPGNIESIVVSPNYANDFTVFAQSGGNIYRSTDGGVAWQQIYEHPISAGGGLIISPNFADDDTLIAAFGTGIWQTEDRGVTWAQIGEQDIDGTSVSSLILAGESDKEKHLFAGMQDKVFRWTIPAPPLLPDLYIGETDIWTDPNSIHQGDLAGVGVTAHSISDQTLMNVELAFYDGNPNQGGLLLGRAIIPFMAPNEEGIQWTGPVWDTSGLGSSRQVYVVVDPDNEIPERDESNNAANRTILILPPSTDETPPVGSLSINNDTQITSSRDVTLQVEANDGIGDSNGLMVYFVEYEYNQAVEQWIPAQQSSSWQAYNVTPTSYPWTLLPGGGLKHLQAWFMDDAGNISDAPAEDFINYVPAFTSLQAGKYDIYRFHIETGSTVAVQVIPESGDADLYVWRPNSTGTPDYYSNLLGMEPDGVNFVAPETGLYQVEVFGFSDITYTLAFSLSGTVSGGTSDKIVPDNAHAVGSSPPTHCFILQPLEVGLTLTKTVSNILPNPGERITYTIGIENHGFVEATNIVISDTLPDKLTFVDGSTALEYSSGTMFFPIGEPPLLAPGFSIAAGQQVSLTFAVTVNTGLDNGLVITNTAAVTSTEILTPQMGSQSITLVDTQPPEFSSINPGTHSALITPTLGVVLNTSQPIFDWEDATDNSRVVSYTLLVTDTQSVLPAYTPFPKIVGQSMYTPTTDLPDSTYTWTVIAYDTAGNANTYPAPQAFQISTIAKIYLPVVVRQ